MEFQANTFEEIDKMSKQHGTEMFKSQDPAHLEAMQKMGELMKSPGTMQTWFEAKRKEFEALPEHPEH
ncbi:MAG: DUF1059 domain-containing protein [Bacteroidota bacterium]